MKRYLLYIVLTVVLSTAGCTRGQWLDEVVAQRDEQEDVVPILRAAKAKGLTVDSAEEIERTNKYYTVDTANGYYNEFKRYRLVFSDKTTVEFDVLGQLNGVKSDYYEKRGVAYISSIDLVDVVGGLYIWIAQSDGMGGGLSFQYTTPNNGGNTPENNKIYYTSTDGGVVTPNDTTVFGANIFSNTYENGQGVITFDGKVMEIGGQAFYNCSSLTSITIPDSVTYIGYNAFHNCDALTSITIPDSVTSIGGQAFYGCSSLVSITIPDSVTSIGYMAFAYCSSLTSITIPDSVISIGSSAFAYCTSLTSVTIPDSVTSIGESAFSGCSSLAEFSGKFASEDGRCLIIDGVLNSFATGCDLTEYTIPDGVTEIGFSSFASCSKLTSITIPNSVTSIGQGAFSDCSSLANITIPDSVTSIGVGAFYNCSSLAEVYCKPTTPPAGNSFMFNNNVSGRKIYVPEESVEAYKSANYWSDYADDFVAYDFEKGEVVNLENRKIYYTSTDGNVVTPYYSGTSYFGANIISNTYADGQGVITFDGNVTKIGNYAFRDCSSLVSITIPDGVTSIGYRAFYNCSSLASVTIGNGVTSIGNCAFESCSSLTSITIPDSVTSIGNAAFHNCTSLASITIPDSVTSIGSDAFSGCTSLPIENNIRYADTYVVEVTDKTLTSYTLKENVRFIGDSAFSGCTSLTSITIPEGVTKIGKDAFYYCSRLMSINIPDSVISIGSYAFAHCSSLASVYCKPTTPPSGSSSMFDDNASGRKIYVPAGSVEAYKTADGWSEYGDAFVPYDFEKGEIVYSETQKIYYTSTDGNVIEPYHKTCIGQGQIVSNTYENGRGVIVLDREIGDISDDFQNCQTLKTITIPDNVSIIGGWAFRNCTSLESFTISENVVSIGDGAFQNCSSLTSVTLPNNVTTLGVSVFSNCQSLNSATIGSGITFIANNAFYQCGNLASVVLSNNVEKIGDYAFYECTQLSQIEFPSNLKTIGLDSFGYCANIESITLPQSITTIGGCAFRGCTRLQSIYCQPITPPTAEGGIMFDNNASGRKIYVPAESIEAYKSANYWSNYADAFVPYDFEMGEVVNLENRKIYYTSTDGNVVTPNKTNEFGANIVSNTYADGQGVITFDGNVTKIGYQAFYECSSLASITIPEGVTTIGNWAFYKCKSLTSITIPDSVTSIGKSAFAWCSSLASITIHEGVTSIGDDSFIGCSKLTSITIPNSVTSIGYQAFWDCSSLVSITIPDSVTSIGFAAFRYCRNLAEVYCKSSMPPTAVPSTSSSPYWDAFDDNASGRKIYVPEESVEAYKTAEWWSEYADAIEPYVFE